MDPRFREDDTLNDVEDAGIHAHTAGKDERAGFRRRKFERFGAGNGENFLETQARDGEGAGTTTSAAGVQNQTGRDILLESDVLRRIAIGGNVNAHLLNS